jgi:ubiquinone/menaquinone biosynthesis C-methylase UbiE
MPIASEAEIQQAYQDDASAARYIEIRFESELNRLLNGRQVAAIQRVLDQAEPHHILEIAPGPGRITRQLRPTGRLVCLEYNQSMIEQGRPAVGAPVTWVRGNGFRLPFAEQFDLVYSFRFVRHFHHEDRTRLYSEVKRVLKPGGLFLLDAVNRRVSQPLRNAHPEEYPIYDKLYREEELRGELTQAGLEPIAIEPVQRFFTWQSLSQVLIGPRANWLNRWIIRGLERLPRRDGLEWIVTCHRG